MKTKMISSIYMQRWLGAIACAMVMMFTFTSCDEHDPLDLNIYPGFVLCDDHQIMSLEDYKAQLQAPHSVRAVGVIFSTANQDHKTLAVMLFENEHIQFSNYTPLDCGTSCSADAYDGYVNSVSLKNTYEEVKFKVDEPDPSDPSKTVQNEYTEVHCSPLGQWVDSSHQYGQSDYIPSRAECRLFFPPPGQKPGDGGRLGDSGRPGLCKLSGNGGQGILPRGRHRFCHDRDTQLQPL